MKYFYYLLVLALTVPACSKPESPDISLVPSPAKLIVGKGQFELQPNTQFIVNDHDRFAREAAFFQSVMTKALGQPLGNGQGTTSIEICQSDTFSLPESYALKITPDKIVLAAGDPAGMFYAMETFRQLLPAAIETTQTFPSISLPVLDIYDYPNYSWRGMHLDVSRHFFSIGYLKRYVDLLALYKLNKLHLHLTDDQGWRIEIKKYPELTEEGAWRTFNAQDSVCMEKAKEDSDYALDPVHIVIRNGKQYYGGYYTQEQLRDLVKYAQDRHVEIVPEIDMPGHMMAAINVFPDLACNGKAAWGKVFSTPLCPVNEATYTFVENILSEVMQIFPSKYIHIGADEVEKSSWEESAACRRFMKQNGLKNFNELEGSFVRRVARFLEDRGKQVIVWDDALEGGIDPTLHVMYWRNWVGGVPERAVANGNDLIMAPGDPFYFSRADARLFDTYNKKLLDEKFPVSQLNKIKGLEGCVWSERVPSEKVADARIFPNALALAERGWTGKQQLNWDSFKLRLNGQLKRLGDLGVNYDYKPTSELFPFLDVDTVDRQIGVRFESEQVKPTIYYTTDGSLPTTGSTRYRGEFYITGSALVCAAVFKDGKATGPVLRRQVDYHKAIGKRVTYQKPWNKAYPAGDAGALTDGYRGGNSYGDGRWQGFTNDVDVTVDLGKSETLSSFSATFMQNIDPGVYMPDYLDVSLSDDGKNFKKVLHLENDIPSGRKGLVLKDFSGSLKGKEARYVNVFARTPKKAFVFVDELVIN